MPASVAEAFGSKGAAEIVPLGEGRVHDTFEVRGPGVPLVLQRLNETTFTDLEALTENLRRVTAHLGAKVRAAGSAEPERRVLTPVPSTSGELLHRDGGGATWRAFVRILRAGPFRGSANPETARISARAFGRFLRDLTDLPGPPLRETVKGFHDTPAHLSALRATARADTRGRAAGVGAELRFALEREETANLLADAGSPRRTVHNDTKIGNLLFDDDSSEVLCVVDLDTVMPGLASHDFGDLVRSCATGSPPDLPDDLFRALAAGYPEGAGGVLTEAEISSLPDAGRVIALELGCRYLRDHISGRPRLRERRAGESLDRARSLFRLVRNLEDRNDEHRRILDGVA